MVSMDLELVSSPEFSVYETWTMLVPQSLVSTKLEQC